MFDYISYIMEKTGFSVDAMAYYQNLLAKQKEEDFRFLEMLQKEYFMEYSKDETLVNQSVEQKLKAYAELKHFDMYGFSMLFLLYCSERLKKIYQEKGYSDTLFFDLMKDLSSKNEECRQVKGEWGTFVFPWFHRHYLCTRFALGRFQYETIAFDRNYCFGNIKLTPGKTVYNLHIPSLGPLTEEIRKDSYQKAFYFYGFQKAELMPIVCHSWILYPENEYIFDKTSNLYNFFHDFHIIASGICENAFPNAWRVFNTDFNGNTNSLPQNTSLQKNIVHWLNSGKKIGDGYGILLFDGEKIVNTSTRERGDTI